MSMLLKAFIGMYITGFSMTSGLSAIILIQNSSPLKNFISGVVIGAGASVVFPILIVGTAVGYPIVCFTLLLKQ